MIIFNKIMKIFKPCSDEELASKREELRQSWLKDGDERKRAMMNAIDKKRVKRANKKYKEEYSETKTRHREHGWYLPNDD